MRIERLPDVLEYPYHRWNHLEIYEMRSFINDSSFDNYRQLTDDDRDDIF